MWFFTVLLGQEEPPADLPVGQALPDQGEDLPLPSGQARQRGRFRLLLTAARRVISLAVALGSSSARPAATARTADTRSEPWICYRTYPEAPAMIESSRAPSSSNEVSIGQARSGMPERS